MSNLLRRLTVTVTTTVLTGAVLLVTAPAAMASPESDLVAMINRERTSRGLTKLTVAADLVEVARRHSMRMAVKGSIYHNPDLYSEVRNWQALGENVGAGRTALRVHNAFMGSSSHRSNILRSRNNKVGVGVVSRDGVLWVTQVFAQRGTVVLAPAYTTRRAPAASTGRVSPASVAPPRRVATPSRTVAVLVRLASR